MSKSKSMITLYTFSVFKVMDTDIEKPNYYAIIPAKVRYDNDLVPLAKLLYSEISALSNKEGHCWASNKYFADLYGVSVTWVSITIKTLQEKKYITCELLEHYKRIIKVDPLKVQLKPPLSRVKGVLSTVKGGVLSTVKDNNTSINKEKIYKKEKQSPVPVDDTPQRDIQPAKQTIVYCSGYKPNICGHCSKCSLLACTDLEIWELSKDLNIWIDSVREKHKQIMEMIDTGEFQKKYKTHKTVYRTLKKWMEIGVERGYYSLMGEMQQMAIQLEHPTEKAKTALALKIAKERGLL